MPTLMRFLTVCAVLAVLAAGAVFYLANFVHPHTREMSVPVPTDKIGQ